MLFNHNLTHMTCVHILVFLWLVCLLVYVLFSLDAVINTFSCCHMALLIFKSFKTCHVGNT